MTDVLGPDIVEQSSSRSELQPQLDKLDSLLERYLNLIHEYQTARQEISRHLSSGFFSLARANFNNSTGTRYGQDYYDERMQATRRISISGTAESPKFESRLDSTEPASPNDLQDEKASENSKEVPVDPLRWFGILVPPALRTAQANFRAAVEGPVPKLASITKQMRALEPEISRLRKSIKRLRNENVDSQ
ncbi:hypothetical protein NA57DRAFT_70957 [Rhizodiscina lignyota]|uniref:Vacuolar ATPase assembly protein VMA22 n=1 Tax=Rhizodiscina lignyota TaxID=1504668 RepID=A0A9P4INH1_9PEZI|nr:hypothetical protein NA57DRAFT_70957 [Rhizodiscina lignyota]